MQVLLLDEALFYGRFFFTLLSARAKAIQSWIPLFLFCGFLTRVCGLLAGGSLDSVADLPCFVCGFCGLVILDV